MSSIAPLFAIPGGMELVIFLFLAALLFGANKLPKLARSLGAAQGEFEKGRVKAEEELRELEESNAEETESAERSRQSV